MSVVKVGDTVAGKFRVDRILGEGAMGIVVAATHLQLREQVALKFLRREMRNDEDVVARFAQEARSVAKLKSEHVARVRDVGTLEDGLPFMVMEYLEGRDLASVLERDGPLPISVAVEYIIQACEGLAEAHARGIVHRDVKPENLFLVDRDGWQCVKILDFGISKAALTQSAGAGSDSEIAAVVDKAGLLIGSPSYMSPEQLRSSRSVDHRADLWSLGAVLFELLTGKTPFDGDRALSELITSILEEAPASLLDLRPDAPVGLELTVRRCLQKDRERRFQNAAELAIELLPFAPRRARVAAEKAVFVTRNAGLSDASLSLPPSIFPSGVSGPAADGGSLSAVNLKPPRLPTIDPALDLDARAQRTSSSAVVSGKTASAAPLGAVAPDRLRHARVMIGAFLAALALALGVVVARAPETRVASPPPRVVEIASPASTAAPTSVAVTPGALVAQLRVETTPLGARVREEGVELCAATPCVVTYQGAAATAKHTLSLFKPGFRAETKEVQGTDGALSIGLVKASSASPPRLAKPAGAPSDPSAEGPSTPEGFKGLPY